MLSMAKATGLTVLLALTSCFNAAESAAHHNFTLVGSTACDEAIKTALGIAVDTKCDFIRWNLAIDPSKQNSFTLDANYGEAQPNTTGFVVGGSRITAAGKFEITGLSTQPGQTSATASKRRTDLYRFRSREPSIEFSLVKLNASLFQLMMPDGSMMVGNGGWSYTLNRMPPLEAGTLPASVTSPARTARTVFDGRTPCKELAALLGIRAPAEVGECFKIKWRITLERDPTTLEPMTFTMDTTINRRETLGGRWTEKKVGSSVIYILTPDKDLKPYSLLVADENLLLFLDAGERLLVGNKDFSFTLNRRSG